MLELAKSVGALVADISKSQSPSTSSSRCTNSSSLGPDSSPSRRDRAFRRIVEREGLTPRRLARARVMFRGRTEVADEYLSFGDGPGEGEARREWLNMELEAVLLLRAHRQTDSSVN